MLLLILSEDQAWAARVAHTEELIDMFKGYIVAQPQHAEYYDSVIQHLEVILKGYKDMAEKVICKPTLN